jgi:AmiR/NasT family two-component response regulator
MSAIEAAKELLMGRHHINAVQAGDLLDKMAAEQGVPVEQVVTKMVDQALAGEVLMEGDW